MGTITSRKRKDGSEGHTVQIRIKRKGVVVHTEAQTFDRLPAARLWRDKREAELAKPGALEALRAPDPRLADVIDKYLEDTRKEPGRTKKQVLNAIKASKLARLQCSKIQSSDVIEFVQGLEVQPQTAGNYLSHLAAVFKVARPAWGYQLNPLVIDDARLVAQRLGMSSRSKQRDRRPTLDELDKIMTHFGKIHARRPDAIPMQEVIVFAIFSTRRQEEITRIQFQDLNVPHSEIWVRDMKHPGEKVGNDVATTLTPEALQLILLRRGDDENRRGPVFPYNPKSISAAFTRACDFLAIDDLTFHDLRHDGISRLFELGWNIPHAAGVSGHRTWNSLKRYTHIRQAGDKYADWPWLERLGITARSQPVRRP